MLRVLRKNTVMRSTKTLLDAFKYHGKDSWSNPFFNPKYPIKDDIESLYVRYFEPVMPNPREAVRELTKRFDQLGKGTAGDYHILMSLAHGDLNAANILIDALDHVWIIDFAFSEEKPLFWDLAKMEIAFLFEYTVIPVTLETLLSCAGSTEEDWRRRRVDHWLGVKPDVSLAFLRRLQNFVAQKSKAFTDDDLETCIREACDEALNGRGESMTKKERQRQERRIFRHLRVRLCTTKGEEADAFEAVKGLTRELIPNGLTLKEALEGPLMHEDGDSELAAGSQDVGGSTGSTSSLRLMYEQVLQMRRFFSEDLHSHFAREREKGGLVAGDVSALQFQLGLLRESHRLLGYIDVSPWHKTWAIFYITRLVSQINACALVAEKWCLPLVEDDMWWRQQDHGGNSKNADDGSTNQGYLADTVPRTLPLYESRALFSAAENGRSAPAAAGSDPFQVDFQAPAPSKEDLAIAAEIRAHHWSVGEAMMEVMGRKAEHWPPGLYAKVKSVESYNPEGHAILSTVAADGVITCDAGSCSQEVQTKEDQQFILCRKLPFVEDDAVARPSGLPINLGQVRLQTDKSGKIEAVTLLLHHNLVLLDPGCPSGTVQLAAEVCPVSDGSNNGVQKEAGRPVLDVTLTLFPPGGCFCYGPGDRIRLCAALGSGSDGREKEPAGTEMMEFATVVSLQTGGPRYMARLDQDPTATRDFVPLPQNHLVAPAFRYKQGDVLLVLDKARGWVEMRVRGTCERQDGARHHLSIEEDLLLISPRGTLQRGRSSISPAAAVARLSIRRASSSQLALPSPSSNQGKDVWMDLNPFNHCPLRLPSRSIFEDELKKFRLLMKARYSFIADAISGELLDVLEAAPVRLREQVEDCGFASRRKGASACVTNWANVSWLGAPFK